MFGYIHGLGVGLLLVLGDAAPSLSTAQGGAPLLNQALDRVGRFHVVLVHFPIALLLLAAGGEAWCVLRRVPGRQGEVDRWRGVALACAGLGAASAVVVAILGWARAWAGFAGDPDPTLWAHRWVGTAAAGVALLVLATLLLARRPGAPLVAFRATLFAAAILTAVTAHFGGTLVHGAGFLAWPSAHRGQ